MWAEARRHEGRHGVRSGAEVRMSERRRERVEVGIKEKEK